MSGPNSRPEMERSNPATGNPNKALVSWLPAILTCCFYFLIALILIPLAGIQSDEAIFTSPFYAPSPRLFRIRAFHHDIPLMVMTYIGTLKTFLYWLIFFLWTPNVWSLRLPVVLIGCASLLTFYALIRRSLDQNAALWGAVFLATDPVFLLTNTFDWGPVAVEHCLFLLACLFLVSFVQVGGEKRLGAGFLFLGLALWNKAIFLWALSATVGAALIVFRVEIWTRLTRRNLKIAAGGFCLGCLPLLIYNIRSVSGTLRENAHLEFSAIPSKFIHLQLTANGTSLFGYMVAEEWMEPAKTNLSAVARASVWLRERVGERRETYFAYLLLALIVAIPLWWRQRAAWFALLFCAIAWLEMAATRDAGGSAHHVILLWPFPILFVVAALRWRWLFVPFVAMNLLVLNQYVSQFERYGPANVFTDAIFPLSQELGQGTGTVYIADWGLFDNLQLMHQGKLLMKPRGDEVAAEPRNEAQDRALKEMLLDQNGRIVTHVAERQVYPGQLEKLDAYAKTLRLHRTTLQTIADSNTRPVFLVLRYVAD